MENPRPSASVVIPFAGPPDDLRRLAAALEAMITGPGDEVIIADNRRPGSPALPGDSVPAGVRIVRADRLPSPALARNTAAATASGDWLVFIDADTVPEPGLLDAYFDPAPGPGTAILAGAILDVAARSTLMARHDVARQRMSQEMTLQHRRPYAQTANCAVLRSAFHSVHGFDEQARGEDADLCFRMFEAGWEMEQRPAARVTHWAREGFREWLSQQIRHGRGAGWLNARYPGQFPRRGWRFLLNRLVHLGTDAARALAHGEPEQAGFAVLDLLRVWAFELGWMRPDRPRRWR
jgi:mycofactocin glycosyltransferase